MKNLEFKPIGDGDWSFATPFGRYDIVFHENVYHPYISGVWKGAPSESLDKAIAECASHFMISLSDMYKEHFGDIIKGLEKEKRELEAKNQALEDQIWYLTKENLGGY